MSPEAQRIAIAEACGWKDVGWNKRNPAWPVLDGIDPHSKLPYREKIPNFTNDLNAMHEAEKVLTGFQWYDWCQCIHGLTSESKKDLWDTASIIEIQQATAAQRCEAFLRCLNLWKD